jgi:hypothetical protein
MQLGRIAVHKQYVKFTFLQNLKGLYELLDTRTPRGHVEVLPLTAKAPAPKQSDFAWGLALRTDYHTNNRCGRGVVAMSGLDEEIAAFDLIRADLEAAHRGEWALVRDRTLFGPFASFQLAAAAALKRFGLGPYLIRQIGAAPIPLPASLVYPSEQDAKN